MCINFTVFISSPYRNSLRFLLRKYLIRLMGCDFSPMTPPPQFITNINYGVATIFTSHLLYDRTDHDLHLKRGNVFIRALQIPSSREFSRRFSSDLCSVQNSNHTKTIRLFWFQVWSACKTCWRCDYMIFLHTAHV